jgi:hypothetical protein
MKKQAVTTLRAFLIELAVYAPLLVGYFFLVLHYLGGWLYQLEIHERRSYAAVAVFLIISQAILLEALTTFLLRLIRGRPE